MLWCSAQLRSQIGLIMETACVCMSVYLFKNNQTKGLSGLLPFAFILENEGFGEKDCLSQDPTPLYFPRDVLAHPI